MARQLSDARRAPPIDVGRDRSRKCGRIAVPARMETFTDSSRICSRCLGDRVLASRIESSGSTHRCAFCERNRPTIGLGALARRLSPVLVRHFEVATSPSPADSSRVLTLSEMLGQVLPHAASRRVLDVIGLSLQSNHGDRSGPDSDFWLDDQRYEVAFPFWGDLASERLEAFRRRARTRRSMSGASRAFLGWLFDDVADLEVREGSRSGRARTVVSRLQADTPLYRGRIPATLSVDQAIQSDPARQMSVPPPAVTPAGRLNPAGSPVFYGAFDRATCIAEVRPSIGDDVYTAEFRLSRALIVLDFRLLELACDQHLSLFSRDYRRQRTRRDILGMIHEFIRVPIRRHERHEYRTTQAVADYLAKVLSPRIDAVIFASAQREKGRNVAIFGHALAFRPRGDDPAEASTLQYVQDSLWFHNVRAIDYRSMDFPFIAPKPRRMMFS